MEVVSPSREGHVPSFVSSPEISNITRLLSSQCLTGSRKSLSATKAWLQAKATSASTKSSREIPMPPSTKSAISIAFSFDGTLLASTHGDHTVKISNYESRKVIQTLEGHPRTPWCVKFHPSKNNILASGCLGYQVNIWDTSKASNVLMNSTVLRHAIISLSFHVDKDILSIASGNALYLWKYLEPDAKPVVAIVTRKPLRCVVCPHIRNPETGVADKIIIGVSNQSPGNTTGASKNLTISLKLITFDPDLFISPSFTLNNNMSSTTSTNTNNTVGQVMKACVNIHSKVVLYNDGGIDVTPCGRYLVVCTDGTPANTTTTATTNTTTRGSATVLPDLEENDSSSTYCLLSLISIEAQNVGRVIYETKLQGVAVGGVTSVKLSPCAQYILLGFGVRDREQRQNNTDQQHRVVSVEPWMINQSNNNTKKCIMTSNADDVNIAIFSPNIGGGYVFGTKQGRVVTVGI